MSDEKSTTSGPVVPKQDGGVVIKQVARYYNPYKPNAIVKSRSYASSIVSSQETMLENLRWTRQQLEREDKALARLQLDLDQQQFPKKWTNHRHLLDKDDDDL